MTSHRTPKKLTFSWHHCLILAVSAGLLAVSGKRYRTLISRRSLRWWWLTGGIAEAHVATPQQRMLAAGEVGRIASGGGQYGLTGG